MLFLYQLLSGIYSSSTCDCSVNHEVLIVGYGSSGATDYWIIKNRWCDMSITFGANKYYFQSLNIYAYKGIELAR